MSDPTEVSDTAAPWHRRGAAAARHPMRWLRGLCAGESAFPLVVLFGLNAVDELDRAAFGVLLPNIRDAFDLDNSGVLTLVASRCRSHSTPTASHACRSRSAAPPSGRSSPA